MWKLCEAIFQDVTYADSDLDTAKVQLRGISVATRAATNAESIAALLKEEEEPQSCQEEASDAPQSREKAKTTFLDIEKAIKENEAEAVYLRRLARTVRGAEAFVDNQASVAGSSRRE